MTDPHASRAEADAAAVDDVVEPDDALSPLSVDQLPQLLQDAVTRAGWPKLMPVQSRSLPYLLDGRDLMIQSRTGSGKTAAFVLPMVQAVDTGLPQCQALVLVPTRELAQQVAREAVMLAGGDGLRVISVYGGVGYAEQLDAFKKGAHLVVGTPGRVLDHLMRGTLKLDSLRMLVMDEADRMLSIGFYPDMKEVQTYLPEHRVHTIMTSATFPPHVMRLAEQFMTGQEILSLSHKIVHVAETPHTYYAVKPMEKDRALVRIIEMENPASAIIFCNTKHNVNYLAAVLQRFGYDAGLLSGDLSQNKREEILARMREGRLRFLVATDVAARGIDIPDLSHVVLYEPPEDREIYIHRAGRTGRAGASGEVISLVDVMERMELQRIAKMYGINLEEMRVPTDEDVAAMLAERLVARLEAELRGLDGAGREALAVSADLARRMGAHDEAVLLLAMLLDACYLRVIQSDDDALVAVAPPRPEGDATVAPGVDEARLADHLEAAMAGLGRLEKERLERFVPMARRMAQDEEMALLGALLLDRARLEVKAAPPSAQGGDGDRPKRKRKRRPRHRRKPSDSEGGRDGQGGGGTSD